MYCVLCCVDCGGSLKDGIVVDSFLVRPNVPFYFIWCRDEFFYGFTRQPGNSSSITNLGFSPLDNNDGDTLINVNDGGTFTNITSACRHTPGVAPTVAENSWNPERPSEFQTACCILTWTPPENYTNDIYLQSATNLNNKRYV